MQLILISGLSGSGKSVALRLLEDAEFYCIDNLPGGLLPRLVHRIHDYGHERIAISVDTRSAPTLKQLPRVIDKLRARGINVRLLFLDANDETLIKRYSETRRRHPLTDGQLTLTECIVRERGMLADIQALGLRLDTSDLSANQLRSWVRHSVDVDHTQLTVIVQSFGFKHGVPLDADFMFDVRCLPNPYYDPALRALTGRDQAVIDFLEADPLVERMYQDIHGFITRWLPEFIRDNRSYLTVAIGCTGGQHRSVYLAERLVQELSEQYTQVLLRHRQYPPVNQMHDAH